MIVNLALGTLIWRVLGGFMPSYGMGLMGRGVVETFIWIVPSALICAGFGAVGGFLSLQLFFKDRRRAQGGVRM